MYAMHRLLFANAFPLILQKYWQWHIQVVRVHVCVYMYVCL